LDEGRYEEAAQTYKNLIEKFGDDAIWADEFKRARFLAGLGKGNLAVISSPVCADLEGRIQKNGMAFLASVLSNKGMTGDPLKR
jgi:hypothetical protein